MKLVLLPGMDGTGILFSPFIESLPKDINFKVLPLIQKVGTTYEEQAQRVAAQIDHPSTIVAESYSGMVAIELARQFPEKVEKIVFVASFINRPSYISAFARFVPTPFLALAKRPNRFLSRLLFWQSANQSLMLKFSQALSVVSAEVIKFRLEQVSKLQQPKVQITTPCLYLLARQDSLVSRNALQAFESVCHQLQIKELEGTHFLLQTNPQGAWSAIQKYCTQQWN